MTLVGSVITVDPQDFYEGVLRVTATDSSGETTDFDVTTKVVNSLPNLVPGLRKCFPYKVGEIGYH